MPVSVLFLLLYFVMVWNKVLSKSINLFSCSTQPSIKFKLLINAKLPI